MSSTKVRAPWLRMFQDGHTPLDLVKLNIEDVEVQKRTSVETVLREYGASDEHISKHSLRYAAENGLLQEVLAHIKEGADVNERNRVSYLTR